MQILYSFANRKVQGCSSCNRSKALAGTCAASKASMRKALAEACGTRQTCSTKGLRHLGLWHALVVRAVAGSLHMLQATHADQSSTKILMCLTIEAFCLPLLAFATSSTSEMCQHSLLASGMLFWAGSNIQWSMCGRWYALRPACNTKRGETNCCARMLAILQAATNARHAISAGAVAQISYSGQSSRLHGFLRADLAP